MPQRPPVLMSIAKDSNLLYLPFVYILPEDVIAKCPTLLSLPRKVREIVYNEKMMAIVESDIFLKEIMEAIAALVFPHFGFRGWKEDYTEFSPAWILVYHGLPLWVQSLENEIGWGLQSLFLIPHTTTIPFFSPDYIKDLIGRVVKRGIAEGGWQATLDAVRKMPCDEDFEGRDTNVRKDFLRRWYHTRSKKVKMVSLEACMEDEEHGIHYVEDVSSSFENSVVAEDFCERFKARLSDKDIEILELRVLGFTYEEIADKLRYKNHSGVIKRIRSIAKEFEKYEEQQERQ